MSAVEVLARARCERHWRKPCDMSGCAEFGCEWRKGAEADLATLTAAGYAVEQGWQPIETAPKDGPILVAQDGEQAVVEWMTALEDGAGDWIIWRRVGPDALAVRMPKPTHWRPLPAPPAGEATP